MDSFDIANMRASLDLATLGPAADPNPRVGCVATTAGGSVAGAGYHRGAGTAHAEVAALDDAAAHGRDVRGGTVYVTLEPCAHIGRTGPCADALIEAGVARVVMLRRDPGEASGGGSERLRAAGITVDVVPDLLADTSAQGSEAPPAADVEADPEITTAANPVAATTSTVAEENRHVVAAIARAAAALVEPWEFATRHGRPFVTWKYAATLDGRSAAKDGTSQWITGEAARADVHARRAAAGAVVAGTGTVLADDPALTVRDATGEPVGPQPLRVVVGEREVPASAKVFDTVEKAEPAIHLRTRDVRAVLAELHGRGIRHVWLEGGPTLAAAFLAADAVDEIVGYLAPAMLGAGASAIGDLGIESIDGIARFELRDLDRIGGDIRVVMRRTAATVASAAAPTPHATPETPETPETREAGPLMFTGIVEEVGEITAVERSERSAVVRIHGPKVVSDARPGDSIAVSGVCLTVVDFDEQGFSVDVMAETLDRSSLAGIEPGARVNLERAMAADGRFGGHFVQGHVDGTGTIAAREPGDRWEVVSIDLPVNLRRYVVEKGSIALDGVSLTVSAVTPTGLQVSLIPTTLAETTLGATSVGSQVNVEVDVLAKYIEGLLAHRRGD